MKILYTILILLINKINQIQLQNIVETNHGPITYIETNSDAHSVTLFKLNNGRIAQTVSYNNVLVWKLTDNEFYYSLRFNLTEHTNTVKAICQSGGFLFTGSLDQSINIWNSTDGSLYSTISNAHNNGVYGLMSFKTSNEIASSSGYGKIRIWNYLNQTMIREIDAHTALINSLVLLSNNVDFVSSSTDGTIKMWSRIDDEFVETLTNETGISIGTTYKLLALENGYLASAGTYETIYIWNTATKLIEKSLIGHNESVMSLCLLKSGYLLSGAFEHLKIWRLNATIWESNYVQGFEWTTNSIMYSKDYYTNNESITNYPDMKVSSLEELDSEDIVIGSSDGYIRFYPYTTYTTTTTTITATTVPVTVATNTTEADTTVSQLVAVQIGGAVFGGVVFVGLLYGAVSWLAGI